MSNKQCWIDRRIDPVVYRTKKVGCSCSPTNRMCHCVIVMPLYMSIRVQCVRVVIFTCVKCMYMHVHLVHVHVQ